MKTVLVAVNARYSHSSLAIRYIEKYNKNFNIELREFSINDSIGSIYGSLLESGAQVYCFSCYIWNIEIILKVAELLKKAVPFVKVIFGGPESGYNAKYLLEKYTFIDSIIKGEGEITTGKILKRIVENKPIDRFYVGEVTDISNPIMPYTLEDIKNLSGKIIYFETSRGCPFNCAYCLSSAEHGVRYFPMEYVKSGLKLFFDENVPLVKLIDRTFNSSESRAIEIIDYIVKNSKNTRVHFEIEAQILTDKLIDKLRSAPDGMFQLEIGIQTINTDALNAVHRWYDLNKTKNNIIRLKENLNMHIHLDLIAGLPYEDYQSFRLSFNYVYSMKPDMLQLGFLKVLKGTEIEEYSSDIQSADFPPYEVISTKWLSAAEILRLKEVEAAVDVFYNSHNFDAAIKTLDENINDYFSLYERLADIFKAETKFGKIKRTVLYEILHKEFGEIITRALAEDFIRNNKTAPLPKFLQRRISKSFKNRCTELLTCDRFIKKYKISTDLKDLRFENILDTVYVMDYKNNKLCDITEDF